jgi:ribonuclease VapC
VVPVTEYDALKVAEAYSKWGKGVHPAGLNFGDCFAYALAKATAEPLLFKGHDFSQTDINVAA